MKKSHLMKKVLGVVAAAAALSLGSTAHAESNFQTGTGALTGTARLDFRITIPKILYIRVGTGTALAANATVDLLDFAPGAATIGNGVATAATAGSGDLGTGAVTARVIGNNGNVSFTSTTIGSLSDGAGGSIPFSEINVASTVLTSATALPHPTLVANGGTSAATTLTAAAKVVNLDARWTYTYRNTNVVAAGTYGGVNTNNGRVTYTVSLP